MNANKVTKQEFAQAKRWLRVFRDPRRVARKLGRSYKTVVQIKNSRTFKDYVEQHRAQHPPVEYSLADQIKELHRLTFYKDGEPYVSKSARLCVGELIENKLKENK